MSLINTGCVQSAEQLYLPDQSPVLNVVLSSEVDDHRRAELIDALGKRQMEIFVYFLKQATFISAADTLCI